MKESIKANLIVFLIIATIAFGVSLTFANLTIHDNHDSYKLISIENDSFEPNYIYKVPTIKPKNLTTNKTIENTTYNTTNIEDTTDIDEDDNWETTYDEYDEEDW